MVVALVLASIHSAGSDRRQPGPLTDPRLAKIVKEFELDNLHAIDKQSVLSALKKVVGTSNNEKHSESTEQSRAEVQHRSSQNLPAKERNNDDESAGTPLVLETLTETALSRTEPETGQNQEAAAAGVTTYKSPAVARTTPDLTEQR